VAIIEEKAASGQRIQEVVGGRIIIVKGEIMDARKGEGQGSMRASLGRKTSALVEGGYQYESGKEGKRPRRR